MQEHFRFWGTTSYVRETLPLPHLTTRWYGFQPSKVDNGPSKHYIQWTVQILDVHRCFCIVQLLFDEYSRIDIYHQINLTAIAWTYVDGELWYNNSIWFFFFMSRLLYLCYVSDKFDIIYNSGTCSDKGTLVWHRGPCGIQKPTRVVSQQVTV